MQIKTESGAKVKATKTGIYKKWKEGSHRKISLRGTNNDGNAEESTSFSGMPLGIGCCSSLLYFVLLSFFWIFMFCFSKLIFMYEFKTVEEFLYLFPGEYQCIWFFGLLAFSSFWMVDLSSLHV